jgi:endonuclease/exonuclease/phosphatase family metal-dependent hydrolase
MMKIATYNIASGGFSSYNSPAQLPERLSLLKKAVATIDADVIGLTDTFRWRDIFTAADLQANFGYPHTYHIDMEDTRVNKLIGVAILSRYALHDIATIRLHNRNCIGASIAEPVTGKMVDFFVAYLDDISEATRVQQVQALVEAIRPNRPSVVMGDLNAIWPKHILAVRQKFEQFVASHPDFAKQPGYSEYVVPVIKQFYQASALPLLQRHGLQEGTSDLLSTALTQLHTYGMPEAIFPVDHILVKDCKATDYRTYSDQLFASLQL